MFLRILTIIAPVLLVALVGYLYTRRYRPDLTVMNTLTVDLFSPLLIFSGLTSRHFDIWGSRWLLLGCVLIILGSGLMTWLSARFFRFDPRTVVPPVMFSNTAYMGLPLTVIAFGADRMPAGVALFVVCTLLHMTIGIKIVNRQATAGYMLRNPLLIASFAGVLCNVYSVMPPPWLATAIKILGDASVPLMLFALGARMNDLDWKGWRGGLAGAIACPVTGLLAAWLVMQWLPLPQIDREQLYLFAALPPAVINFLIAEQYNQEPGKVAAIVLFGNIVSVIFVPIGLWLAFAGY